MTHRLSVFLGLALLAPSVASATSLRGKVAVKAAPPAKAEKPVRDWRVKAGTETPAADVPVTPVVVVFIEGVRVAAVVPPTDAATMRTQGFRIRPATVPLVAGQQFEFTNADGFPVTPVLNGTPKKRLDPEDKLSEPIAKAGIVKVTSREWNVLMYGEGRATNRFTTEASIRSVSREDLVAFHKRYFHPAGMIVAVSGAFSRPEMLRKLEAAFSGWPGPRPQVPPVPSEVATAARNARFSSRGTFQWPDRRSLASSWRAEPRTQSQPSPETVPARRNDGTKESETGISGDRGARIRPARGTRLPI
jgi:hypothetical protein